jgi:hypothetical protein
MNAYERRNYPVISLLKYLSYYITKQTKQTPWPLVRERTIPTKRRPLVDEI